MADKIKTENAATEAKPAKVKRPRKARTFHLFNCGVDGHDKVEKVASANTLKELRQYSPTNEQDGCTYFEAVQIGKPFVIRKVVNAVREVVK